MKVPESMDVEKVAEWLCSIGPNIPNPPAWDDVASIAKLIYRKQARAIVAFVLAALASEREKAVEECAKVLDLEADALDHLRRAGAAKGVVSLQEVKDLERNIKQLRNLAKAYRAHLAAQPPVERSE